LFYWLIGFSMMKSLLAWHPLFDRSGSTARLILGLILLERGIFDEEALACFKRASKGHPVAHFLAASVLIAQDNPTRAKAQISDLPGADRRL
jgi:hypothetical protein